MALVQGKVVAVTGASRGIGRGCAREFQKHGASGLILHFFGDADTQQEIDELSKELANEQTKVITVPGGRIESTPFRMQADLTHSSDIADPTTSARIVEEGVAAFGRIDVLVSNAGICPFADFLTMDHGTWELTRGVNLDGAFYITKAVGLQMKNQIPQGGSIIGISSISALVGGGQQVHYTPTKAGILSLMQSTAVALGEYNIRANAILPGTIATDINKEDLKDDVKREGMIKRTCLGRLGAPDDIAGPVVFLASDLAKYVTGAQLLVDGGLFVNLQ
ncbi:hypothetical protein DL96DRAFT_1549889 [Flagelloscypha sp. PMI_526]|nr:hypothetical protein DL96DRAFT_1549889 [Flagelloscypha sp. PMI_526]